MGLLSQVKSKERHAVLKLRVFPFIHSYKQHLYYDAEQSPWNMPYCSSLLDILFDLQILFKTDFVSVFELLPNFDNSFSDLDDSTDFLCMDWDIFNCVFHRAKQYRFPLWEVVCCRLFTCFKHFFHGIFTLVCHSLGTCISVYSSSSMWNNNMNYQEVYYDREHIFLDPTTKRGVIFPSSHRSRCLQQSHFIFWQIITITSSQWTSRGWKKQMKCSIAVWF